MEKEEEEALCQDTNAAGRDVFVSPETSKPPVVSIK